LRSRLHSNCSARVCCLRSVRARCFTGALIPSPQPSPGGRGKMWPIKTAQNPARRSRSCLPLAPIAGSQRTRQPQTPKFPLLILLDHIHTPQQPTDSAAEPPLLFQKVILELTKTTNTSPLLARSPRNRLPPTLRKPGFCFCLRDARSTAILQGVWPAQWLPSWLAVPLHRALLSHGIGTIYREVGPGLGAGNAG